MFCNAIDKICIDKPVKLIGGWNNYKYNIAKPVAGFKYWGGVQEGEGGLMAQWSKQHLQ